MFKTFLVFTLYFNYILLHYIPFSDKKQKKGPPMPDFWFFLDFGYYKKK